MLYIKVKTKRWTKGRAQWKPLVSCGNSDGRTLKCCSHKMVWMWRVNLTNILLQNMGRHMLSGDRWVYGIHDPKRRIWHIPTALTIPLHTTFMFGCSGTRIELQPWRDVGFDRDNNRASRSSALPLTHLELKSEEPDRQAIKNLWINPTTNAN